MYAQPISLNDFGSDHPDRNGLRARPAGLYLDSAEKASTAGSYPHRPSSLPKAYPPSLVTSAWLTVS